MGHVETETVTACSNIGPRERRKRMLGAYFGGALFLLMFIGLIYIEAPVVTRLSLALPAFIGAIGFFQARERTCVAFVAQNIRVMGEKASQENVTDGELQNALKKKARKIYFESLAVTFALVALTMVFPLRF